jgi:hypothetical protein
MENPTRTPDEQAKNAQTKKPWYKKWWVITIGVIFVLYAVGSNGSKNTNTTQSQGKTETKTADTQETKKSAEPEKTAPEVTITSANLSKEYSENEVAADQKYKGKIIEVSGKITSVDNGISDNEMIVRLSDGKYDINNAWCYTQESERDKVLTFKKGQQVTLIGKGDSATLNSPVLKDCRVK